MASVDERPDYDLGEETSLLNRGLGVPGIVFMVVAAVAPLGATSVVIPTVFALSGNASAATYFLVAAGILCLFAVGFTLMSRHVHNAGAFYTYVQAGLGKIPGAGAASLALVSYFALMVSLYTYLGVVASAAVQDYLEVKVHWWVLALAAILVVALLGYRDIEVSAKVLGVVLVLEVLLILTVDIAILLQGGAHGLSAAPFSPTSALHGAPGLGLMFAFFAFIGFESTAVFRTEAGDPDRTIPRATYVAVVLMGVLYAFTAWSQAVGAGVSGIVATAGADPASVMVKLSARYVGSAMQDVVQVLLVTSIFACTLSFHNVVTRYQFNLARGGLLPKQLGEVHPQHMAPSRSSMVMTVVTVCVFGSLTAVGLQPVTQIYTWLSGSATLGIILLMALTSLSVIVFHQRGRGNDPLWNSTVAPILSLAGLCVVLYLVLRNFELLVGGRTAAIAVLLAILASLALGVVVALVARSRRPDAYERLLD